MIFVFFVLFVDFKYEYFVQLLLFVHTFAASQEIISNGWPGLTFIHLEVRIFLQYFLMLLKSELCGYVFLCICYSANLLLNKNLLTVRTI